MLITIISRDAAADVFSIFRYMIRHMPIASYFARLRHRHHYYCLFILHIMPFCLLYYVKIRFVAFNIVFIFSLHFHFRLHHFAHCHFLRLHYHYFHSSCFTSIISFFIFPFVASSFASLEHFAALSYYASPPSSLRHSSVVAISILIYMPYAETLFSLRQRALYFIAFHCHFFVAAAAANIFRSLPLLFIVTRFSHFFGTGNTLPTLLPTLISIFSPFADGAIRHMVDAIIDYYAFSVYTLRY